MPLKAGLQTLVPVWSLQQSYDSVGQDQSCPPKRTPSDMSGALSGTCRELHPSIYLILQTLGWTFTPL